MVIETVFILAECEVQIEASCNKQLTTDEAENISKCRNSIDKFRFAQGKKRKLDKIKTVQR